MSNGQGWLDELAAAVRDPEFIGRNAKRFRAPLKQRTMFGPAGRAVIHTAGERVIYGTNGAALCRVVEDEARNTQIEEAERLHAVVRPKPIRSGFLLGAVGASAGSLAKPAPIRSSFTPKGPSQ